MPEDARSRLLARRRREGLSPHEGFRHGQPRLVVASSGWAASAKELGADIARRVREEVEKMLYGGGE